MKFQLFPTAIKSLAATCLLSLATASAALVQEQIAWFGTLESAQVEAKRTGKPIFLLAARPECRGVPGFW